MYVTSDERGANRPFNLHDGNITMYSSIKKLDATLPFVNFGVKYVMEGIETYRLNEEDFNLKKGEYVLCNPYTKGKVIIDSPSTAEGICIDIKPAIISEVLASYKRPDTLLPDLDLDKYFCHKDFIENKFNADETQLGQKIKKLHTSLAINPHIDHQIEDEFYYEISEAIIHDYLPIIKQIKSISCIKQDTKRALFRTVLKGKEIIDQNYLNPLNIDHIAKEVNISQYHFYRLFKEVYQISPYQYLMNHRMKKAKLMIQDGDQNISQIALEVGYNDVHAFSKAFKKYHGISPSKI